MKKKYNVGYTQGTYDLFHIGHLNLLEHAKEQCEILIVGVNSDKLILQYKNKKNKKKEQDRARIVGALKAVDKVFITETLNKEEILKKIHYDAIFIGDDWKGNERWKKTEEELAKYGVPVEYLPHTDGISTTGLTKKIKSHNEKGKEKDDGDER